MSKKRLTINDLSNMVGDVGRELCCLKRRLNDPYIGIVFCFHGSWWWFRNSEITDTVDGKTKVLGTWYENERIMFFNDLWKEKRERVRRKIKRREWREDNRETVLAIILAGAFAIAVFIGVFLPHLIY